MPSLPRPTWPHRLGVRLAVVIGLVSLVLAGLLLWFVLTVQRRYLLDEAVRGAARFSDTIKASTYHDMLDNRWDGAYRTMRTIGSLEGIEKVRMMNKEGRIGFSTDAGEVGQSIDKRAEACYACHADDRPLDRLNLPSRSRIYASGGHRVLGMVTPIYNEPGCSNAACHVHPAEQQVLGVVDIAVSLREIDREVAALGYRTVAVGLGIVVLLGVAVGLFVGRSVVRPVAGLVHGTRRIARLELDEEIPVDRADELGMLAASFNEMTASLRRARQDLHDLTVNLERQVGERTSALAQAQAQLVQHEKLSSLGRLAASVAHEINNPLAGILTYARLLIRMHEERGDGDVPRDLSVRHLRLIQRETERCTAIVRNLLEFARRRPLTLARTDLDQVVDEALNLIGSRLALQRIEVAVDREPAPAVRADAGQLRQAVLNIVLNAADAMTGGGRLTVTTRPARQRDAVDLIIADTGTGIPAEDLPRILDPFFTTKEKGTGLGLSVVYGIVERHGGTLDIRSRVGRGTVVTIRIPAADAANAADLELADQAGGPGSRRHELPPAEPHRPAAGDR